MCIYFENQIEDDALSGRSLEYKISNELHKHIGKAPIPAIPVDTPVVRASHMVLPMQWVRIYCSEWEGKGSE